MCMGKLASWQSQLSYYSIRYEHIKGVKNSTADWISREYLEYVKRCKPHNVQNPQRPTPTARKIPKDKKQAKYKVNLLLEYLEEEGNNTRLVRRELDDNMPTNDYIRMWEPTWFLANTKYVSPAGCTESAWDRMQREMRELSALEVLHDEDWIDIDISTWARIHNHEPVVRENDLIMPANSIVVRMNDLEMDPHFQLLDFFIPFSDKLRYEWRFGPTHKDAGHNEIYWWKHHGLAKAAVDPKVILHFIKPVRPHTANQRGPFDTTEFDWVLEKWSHEEEGQSWYMRLFEQICPTISHIFNINHPKHF